MTWITTTCGAVNERHVIRVEHTDTGSLLHLVNGQTVKSPLTFDVLDGKLVVIDPTDDDSDDSCPF
jgi:hypothetical protein